MNTLGRRAVDLPANPRLVQHVVDVFDPATYAHHLAGQQVAICTLGVGQSSKIGKAEFVRVNKEAGLAFARARRAAGVKHFELLRSVGANAQSSSFYLRTKGGLNEALTALKFGRLSIFLRISTFRDPYPLQPLRLEPGAHTRFVALVEWGVARAAATLAWHSGGGAGAGDGSPGMH